MLLRFRKYAAPARYGIGLLLVAAAIVLRYALHPLLGDRFPFLLQFLATMAAARYLGMGPALAGLALALIQGVLRLEALGTETPKLINRLWFTVTGVTVFGTILIWLFDRQASMTEQMA